MIKIDWRTHVYKTYNPPTEGCSWTFKPPIEDDKSAKGNETVFLPGDDMPVHHAEVLQAGYFIGREVCLTKRLTGITADEQQQRKDVLAGVVGKVIELPSDASKRITISFHVPQKGKKSPYDVHIKALIDDVDFADTDSVKASKEVEANNTTTNTKVKEEAIYKKYAFLKKPDEPDAALPVQINIKKLWEGQQVAVDNSLMQTKLKCQLALSAIADETELVAPDGLVLVTRGGKAEVWTEKQFKKGTLIIAPSMAEVKDRYWTLGRSVLLRCEKASKEHKKHFALDGRLCGTKIDENKPPSLFWLVERTIDSKAANMDIEYASTEIKLNMSFGSAKRTYKQMVAEPEDLEVPYLVNTKELKPGTRLMACDDLQLRKLATKSDKDKEKPKEKEANAAKKNK
jgi:hypothetical protein